MTVQKILRQKGSAVVTGRPEMTLAEVCKTLAEKKIGALVIVDREQRVVGIVSERDIVRVIAKGGMDALSDEARAHMTHAVTTCTPRHRIDEVMEIMTNSRFRHMPVIENSTLVGLVSIGDVVKYRIAEVEREAEEIKNYITTS